MITKAGKNNLAYFLKQAKHYKKAVLVAYFLIPIVEKDLVLRERKALYFQTLLQL